MTMKQKEVYNAIQKLPEDLLAKVIDYIEYLRFSNLTNNAPNDLIKKLEEGRKATENGEVCSLGEAFDKIEKILID